MDGMNGQPVAQSRHTPDVLAILRKEKAQAEKNLRRSSPYGAASANRRRIEIADAAIAEIERLRAAPVAVFVVGQDEYDGMSPAAACTTELAAQVESRRLQRETGYSHSYVRLEVGL
jgi:hypothetical protein